MRTKFCPQCQSEFYSFVEVCPECLVPLSDSPLGEVESAGTTGGDLEVPQFVVVVSTFNNADIALVSSILDAYSVEYHVLGGNMTFLEALAEPTKFFVKVGDAPRVCELLQDVSLSYYGISTTKPYFRDDE